MQYFLLSVSLFFISQHTIAQQGCTDPQANNYDVNAIENDGTCMYLPTSYVLTEIVQLPNNLDEVSGAAFMAENLWVHEDAGNEDRIYQIDSLTGVANHLLTISNADNYDWEDMTEDETHVYIGDFGNNDGNRTNLRIYKFSKNELSGNVAIPEVIEFSFSDQTDFSVNNNNNNFDCEALFVFEDSIHLFSKNWVDFKTRHYVLPTTPGEFVAQVKDSLEVQAQITSADINDDGVVVLLGYNVATGENLFWLLFDYPGNQFFKGNKRKISLGNALNNSQTEGVAFRDQYTGYVVSEKFSLLPQKLLQFNMQSYLDNTTLSGEIVPSIPNISVFPNPFHHHLNVVMEQESLGIKNIVIRNFSGKKIKEIQGENSSGDRCFTVDFSFEKLPDGIYFLEIQTSENEIIRKKVQQFQN